MGTTINKSTTTDQKPQQTTSNTQDTKSKVIVRINNIFKSYFSGTQETKVLKDVSFEIRNADFLVIVGPSGSGKSTLLHILLGLEIPTAGEIIFLDKNLYENTTEDMRSQFRKEHIGMVYQQPNWIRSMTVLENVAFPLVLRGYQKSLAHEIALETLQKIHMENWAHLLPTELSGGQQQRVSMARCIVHNPDIIFADEPTGNLDFESGQEVMMLLQSLNLKYNKTVIMVTHDIEYIRYATCAINVFDGKIAGYYDKEHLNEFMSSLQTKHVDKDSYEKRYAENSI